MTQNAELKLVIEGPAEDIFKRKLGRFKNLNLETAIKDSDWVICGSSWQSDLECRAISICKSISKKVVTFLDHWINYKERFQVMGELLLPDEIWVGDEIAEKIAKNIFSSTPVNFVPNPYFTDIIWQLNNTLNLEKQKDEISVLYVCEPIREHALLQYGNESYWGYGEEDALMFFLNNIFVISKKIKIIKIRPHPSEDIEKYKWASEHSDLILFSDGNNSLIEEISEADIIVGCESMAMVVGLLAEKRVISCIPPGSRECGLPHSEIEHLQNMGVYNSEINNDI